MRPLSQQFWKDVFIACIRTGGLSIEQAAVSADLAVKEFESRKVSYPTIDNDPY